MNATQPHVVIVGAGFGGLTCAQSLKRAPVQITLIDRTNHHLFQPLLYQVAMAGLSPADIAAPIRAILRKQKNVTVLLDEVTGVDFNRQTVKLLANVLHYDYLVLAAGGRTSYFGHEEWAQFAPGLKDLDDATEIRRRVLLAFEELARYVLARDFRSIYPEFADILLLEGGPRILPGFSEDLSKSAEEQLDHLGVKVRKNAKVTNIDATGVYLGDRKINAATVIWGAGVQATGLTQKLGVPLDRAGRIRIEPDLTVPGHRNVFAIGDMTYLEQDGKPLPGVSPVAMQMGRCVARNIWHALKGEPSEQFRYLDKGSMATIGRNAAIAEIGKLHLRGFPAWVAWLVVHLFFLIGFRNRVAALLNWAWMYFTYQRGARLILGYDTSAKPEPATAAAPPLAANVRVSGVNPS
jgi:NADH:ubiquinone reductase (H+-translocating)